MPVNKVVYGTNTIIDISGSTVTPESMTTGITAYDKTGAKITGTNPYEKNATETAVTNALNAISEKGVSVSGKDIDDLASLIASISSGGKVVTGEFTFGSGNNHTITHNFGEIPNFAAAITATPTKTGKGFAVACMIFGGVEYLLSYSTSYGSTMEFKSTSQVDLTDTKTQFRNATDTTIRYYAGISSVSGVGIYYAVGVI